MHRPTKGQRHTLKTVRTNHLSVVVEFIHTNDVGFFRLMKKMRLSGIKHRVFHIFVHVSNAIRSENENFNDDNDNRPSTRLWKFWADRWWTKLILCRRNEWLRRCSHDDTNNRTISWGRRRTLSWQSFQPYMIRWWRWFHSLRVFIRIQRSGRLCVIVFPFVSICVLISIEFKFHPKIERESSVPVGFRNINRNPNELYVNEHHLIPVIAVPIITRLRQNTLRCKWSHVYTIECNSRDGSCAGFSLMFFLAINVRGHNRRVKCALSHAVSMLYRFTNTTRRIRNTHSTTRTKKGTRTFEYSCTNQPLCLDLMASHGRLYLWPAWNCMHRTGHVQFRMKEMCTGVQVQRCEVVAVCSYFRRHIRDRSVRCLNRWMILFLLRHEERDRRGLWVYPKPIVRGLFDDNVWR